MKIIDNIKNSYLSLIKFSSSFKTLFLLAVRLLWGILFLQAGLGKIANINGTIEFFHSLGIPFSDLMAHLVAWTEAIGGACLVIGFASRLVSLPLMLIMIVAILTAHIPSIKAAFSDPSIFFKQSPFTFFLASLIIFIFGPGKISLDYFFEKLTKSKVE